MISEHILYRKNRIRKIEEELRRVQKNMDKLDAAEKKAAKKDRELIELRDGLMRNVQKACRRGASLRGMNDFFGEMERVIGGSNFEKMYQSVENVKKSIKAERDEHIYNQKRLLKEKEELQREIELMTKKETL